MKNVGEKLYIVTIGFDASEKDYIKSAMVGFEIEEFDTTLKINSEKYICALVNPEGVNAFSIDSFKNSIQENIASFPLLLLVNNQFHFQDKYTLLLSGFGFLQFCIRPYSTQELFDKVNLIRILKTKLIQTADALQELEYLRRKNDVVEHKFKLLSAAVSEPIVFVNQDMQVRFWNKEAQSVFGYSKYEVVSEDFLRWIISPKSHIQIREIFESAAITGNKKLKSEQTFFVKNKLGVEFEIGATISYHSNGHSDFSLAFVFHDLLQERKLDKEIVRNRELREENKLMREFVHTVSHDLRSPMNAIMGISKTLIKYNAENLHERQREGLDIIYESGNQLVKMIQDLVAIVKMDRNKLEVISENIDFDKMLSLHKSQVLHLIDDKPIKFSIKRSASIPSAIKGDQMKINQVLSNLLSNAVKYTNSGKIILSTHIIDNKLFFEIADTGIGIAKEKLNEIFNKFTQADIAFSSIGMGLGLHISKKLIQILQGEITIESEKGKGSIVRFYITLPEGMEYLPTMARTMQLDGDISVYNFKPGKKLILAIDDSMQHAFIYSMLSELNDYSVILTKNGKVGLAAINDYAPDIIILKLEIPELHGTSIIKELIRKNSVAPILAFTDYEHIPINLPKNVMLLPQPFSAEQIIESISLNGEVTSLNKKYKLIVLFDDSSYLKEKFEANPDVLFLLNKNIDLSFIQLLRVKSDYLVFEQAYSKNSSELLFKLIDEIQTGSFKEIILAYDGQPMKFLTQKVECIPNIRLIKKNSLELNDLI